MVEKIVAQIGELDDRVTLFAEHGSHRVVMAHGDAGMALARVLLAAGYDPASPYETARGQKTAMRYSTLAHAASLRVVESRDGKAPPRIVKWRPYPREED
jgi:hypothetical protein